MQVRKYEASTIKEAVDMIKKDLGPDAIILSTRESQRHMGASAGKKVIITAAVAEETYHKKQVVEKNLTAAEHAKLMTRPARIQKQFIEEAFTNLRVKIDEKRRTLETRNYASIPDDDMYEDEELLPPPRRPAQAPAKSAAPAASTVAEKRVKAAVAEALKISKEKEFSPLFSKNTVAPTKNDTAKIDELKGEIKRLQSMVQNMKSTGKAIAPVAGHPGAKYGIPQDMSAMFERLVGEGFEEKSVAELLRNAQLQLKENIKKKGLLDAWIAKWIYSNLEVVKEKMHARYHVFVGPRGVGKTSSLVKMASHLVIKERKRIGIITADTNKVGATEQLRIYSQILNVPFAVWRKGEDINVYLKQMSMVDYVLIDTEGQSLLKMEEIDSLKSFIPYDLGGVRVHLVVSALLKDEELYSVSRRFKSINYHDVVMTNLDQLRKHGILVNFQAQAHSPYFAFSMGPMIPEDFEWASKERVLDLIFKISNSKREGEKND